MGTQQAVCTQDFPYYLEEGVSHDNIWSTTPLSTEQLVQVSYPKTLCHPMKITDRLCTVQLL